MRGNLKLPAIISSPARCNEVGLRMREALLQGPESFVTGSGFWRELH